MYFKTLAIIKKPESVVKNKDLLYNNNPPIWQNIGQEENWGCRSGILQKKAENLMDSLCK